MQQVRKERKVCDVSTECFPVNLFDDRLGGMTRTNCLAECDLRFGRVANSVPGIGGSGLLETFGLIVRQWLAAPSGESYRSIDFDFILILNYRG